MAANAEESAAVGVVAIAADAAPATASSDVYSLAAVVAYAMTGRDGGAPAGRLGDVLERATSAEPEARYADATSFVQAVQASFGSAPAAVPVLAPDNPYKGLRPFTEADAREDPILVVVRRLAAVYTVNTDQAAVIRLVNDARAILSSHRMVAG